MELTPGETGIDITGVTYDPRSHLITVKGTPDVTPASKPPYPGLAPSYPSSTYVTASANQAAWRFRSVTGNSYANVAIPDASATKVPFTTRLLAGSGRFGPGVVAPTPGHYNPYNYYPGDNTLGVVARMRNAKVN